MECNKFIVDLEKQKEVSLKKREFTIFFNDENLKKLPLYFHSIEQASKMILPFLFITSFIWFIYKKYKTSCYPPGPFPLPLIGNLHLLRKDIHLSMDRLSKQYGSMFTLWMADIPFVVITDYQLAKKVCLTKKFADRLPLYVGGELYSRGAKDIIMGDYSPSLTLHRKLAQSAFQMFGGHMEALEGRIITNVENLLQSCQKNINNPRFELFQDIEYTFFNVMSTIVFGDSVSKDSELFIKIRNAVFFMMQSGVTLSMVNFYPVLRHLPNIELKKTNKVVKERDTVLKDVFMKVKAEFNIDSQPTNYIEALLKSKSQSAAEEKAGDEVVFSQDHMEMNIYDMFLAGVETVAVTAMWSVLFLVKWPEVQQTCHKHLERVVGPRPEGSKGVQTRVRMEHKKDLPYFTAVIYETLRLASTLPFGVFHRARESTTLNEYNFEKGKFYYFSYISHFKPFYGK